MEIIITHLKDNLCIPLKTTLKRQQNLQIYKVYFVQKVESNKKKQKTQRNCEVFPENRHI